MKNISIGLIIFMLSVCYILVLYNLAFDFNQLIKQGDLSWSYIINYRKEDLLILLLILLSATGLVVREAKGWILTTQFFYSLMGAIITVLIELDNLLPSINSLTYLLAILALILPIVLMNTKKLKQFYKLDEAANMWINNAIAITIAVLVGLFMWT
ncbi:hypothetical protein SanaruYs_04620 [Chryseotalea sanaruensis]|uniref:Uncharacterized protein n=1 Tax=Chryseotalea sanaruensis TaxID=2482724 RepID=A0A401U5T3_9BACT|nr:hypothetical protein [Chryseotalea sanaruensis]GCC50247.1 hypothetical protein SanaruYs_04620 [Chryseotalea sanaruensis]